jgi:hypothetical protein
MAEIIDTLLSIGGIKMTLIDRMETKNSEQAVHKNQDQINGFRVRLGLQVGAWKCVDCSGQTKGSSLWKPFCDYCEHK